MYRSVLNRLAGPCLIALALFATPAQAGETTDATEVLVVGTLHTHHRGNDSYSYRHVAAILQTYDPDVICVEIRPEDFRHKEYLQEMVMATIWGLEQGRAVVPIDWWDSKRDARAQRAEYARTPEYLSKLAEVGRLERDSEITRSFWRKYGKEEKFRRKLSKYDSAFWNGPEYNDYIREGYRISVEVFGDSSVNLYYLSRNGRMLERIDEAVAANPGARVLVLTGAEHKHFFDDAYAAREDVESVSLSEILPLQELDLPAAVATYLEQRDAEPYFDLTDPDVAVEYYKGRMTRLMHGPDMDFDPNIVPAENVEIAAEVLAHWMWDNPYSPALQYELGWLAFHTGRYQQAILHYDQALLDMNALEEEEERWRTTLPLNIHRNVGLCHDALGQRDEALQAYETGLKMLDETLGEGDDWLRGALFGKLTSKPFAWKRGPIENVDMPELPAEYKLTGRYWHVVDNVTHDDGDGPREILLWAALPVDRREHRVTLGAIAPDPAEILTDPETGNRVVLWRVTDPAEGEQLVFRYDFEVVNRAILNDIDPDRVRRVAEGSPVYQRYTRSEPWIEITPALSEQAATIVGEETHPYQQVKLLFDWVVDVMVYDYPAVADRGAEKSYDRLAGDCGEFSHVFIAMARSLGIPARSVVANWPEGGGHAWAEVYLPPYGWVPADTSMAQLVDSGLKGQMTDEEVTEFATKRGFEEMDRDFLLGNLYPDRLVVFVGDNVTFSPASAPETTFHYLQPGGRAAHPPAISLTGLADTTVDTGLFLFDEEATDGALARKRIEQKMGAAYLTAGLYDRAIAALTSKLEEDPDHATSLFQLGQAHFNLGQFDEARDAFERSITGDGGSTKPTTDTWSHILLGMCCDVTRDRDGAMAHYQKALDMGADFNGSLATAQQLLEEPFELE
jgi:transglutaminase-like putative cysteine protease